MHATSLLVAWKTPSVVHRHVDMYEVEYAELGEGGVVKSKRTVAVDSKSAPFRDRRVSTQDKQQEFNRDKNSSNHTKNYCIPLAAVATGTKTRTI